MSMATTWLGYVAEALATGVVSGIVASLIVAQWIQWRWRPRVKESGLFWIPLRVDRVKYPEPKGRLYKLLFRLGGKQSPEACSLEIVWTTPSAMSVEGKPREYRLFAKWDETGAPIARHDPGDFRPELVPQTYFQPLVTGREYAVPFLYEEDERFEIFTGWWFGRPDYKPETRQINRSTRIALRLAGPSGLREEWEFTVAEVKERARDKAYVGARPMGPGFPDDWVGPLAT